MAQRTKPLRTVLPESDSELSEEEPAPVKLPPRRQLASSKRYTGKPVAPVKPASIKPAATIRSTTASLSPTKSILRQNSPSKGTSVKFGANTSNRLRDFFKTCLTILQNEYLPLNVDPEFAAINKIFQKEELATRLVSSVKQVATKKSTDVTNESYFEFNDQDTPKLSEDKIKRVILALISIIFIDPPYQVLAKINSATQRYQINAYLVPLIDRQFWCNCPTTKSDSESD